MKGLTSTSRRGRGPSGGATPDNPGMRIAFLGFGLIAGSVARALHARATEPEWTLAAWSPTGSGPAAAAAGGVLDAAAADPAVAIDGADLVVLAAPPLACLDLLDRLAGPLRSALADYAVVTDVASTKRRLVARAAELELPFVGGHPMAGREKTGYGAADAELFVGRPWVIVADGAPAEHVERVESLARAAGATPVRMDAATHDAAVAAVSHVPLVVAAALVESVAGDPSGWSSARGLAASGWRDMSRLALGDVAMGAGIAATNADLVAERLHRLRDVIDGWLADLEPPDGPDPERLAARLAHARALLEDVR